MSLRGRRQPDEAIYRRLNNGTASTYINLASRLMIEIT